LGQIGEGTGGVAKTIFGSCHKSRKLSQVNAAPSSGISYIEKIDFIEQNPSLTKPTSDKIVREKFYPFFDMPTNSY